MGSRPVCSATTWMRSEGLASAEAAADFVVFAEAVMENMGRQKQSVNIRARTREAVGVWGLRVSLKVFMIFTPFK